MPAPAAPLLPSFAAVDAAPLARLLEPEDAAMPTLHTSSREYDTSTPILPLGPTPALPLGISGGDGVEFGGSENRERGCGGFIHAEGGSGQGDMMQGRCAGCAQMECRCWNKDVSSALNKDVSKGLNKDISKAEDASKRHQEDGAKRRSCVLCKKAGGCSVKCMERQAKAVEEQQTRDSISTLLEAFHVGTVHKQNSVTALSASPLSTDATATTSLAESGAGVGEDRGVTGGGGGGEGGESERTTVKEQHALALVALATGLGVGGGQEQGTAREKKRETPYAAGTRVEVVREKTHVRQVVREATPLLETTAVVVERSGIGCLFREAPVWPLSAPVMGQVQESPSMCIAPFSRAFPSSGLDDLASSAATWSAALSSAAALAGACALPQACDPTPAPAADPASVSSAVTTEACATGAMASPALCPDPNPTVKPSHRSPTPCAFTDAQAGADADSREKATIEGCRPSAPVDEVRPSPPLPKLLTAPPAPLAPFAPLAPLAPLVPLAPLAPPAMPPSRAHSVPWGSRWGALVSDGDALWALDSRYSHKRTHSLFDTHTCTSTSAHAFRIHVDKFLDSRMPCEVVRTVHHGC